MKVIKFRKVILQEFKYYCDACTSEINTDNHTICDGCGCEFCKEHIKFYPEEYRYFCDKCIKIQKGYKNRSIDEVEKLFNDVKDQYIKQMMR